MDQNTAQQVKELDCRFRFTRQGPTFKENEHGKQVQVDNGGVTCEIIDNATGEMYAKGFDEADESAALHKALRAAFAAAKPLTKAQKADQARRGAETAQHDAALAERDAEIARLRAQVNTLLSEGAAIPREPAEREPQQEHAEMPIDTAPKRRGRPPKQSATLAAANPDT